MLRIYQHPCTFVWVKAHSSILTVSSGFSKLATCIRWADSNGTKGGQHRRVSLYQIIRGHEPEDSISQGHYRNSLRNHSTSFKLMSRATVKLYKHAEKKTARKGERNFCTRTDKTPRQLWPILLTLPRVTLFHAISDQHKPRDDSLPVHIARTLWYTIWKSLRRRAFKEIRDVM